MTAKVGTVYLVGAGPGDPGLITVRGLRALRAADVVLHDRLVAAELLAEVRAGAEVLDVSKYPGFQKYTQAEINALLVARARAGLCVVRLKGGDPFVFGRGGAELLACRAAGVACVVIPGVTSATAVPAAAGIPVTHRGIGRSFAVITGEIDRQFGEAENAYASLAQLDTIVLMMGLGRLAEFTDGLLDAGRAPDTPAACIESGWTAQERVVVGTLATIAERVSEARLRAPVVTVIGAVAEFAVFNGAHAESGTTLARRDAVA
jgi:uroporphyrin-III C-methyltransferase